MSPAANYDKPFHWWGPGWGSPRHLTIGDLLRDGTIDVDTGALLWAVLARRESLAVIGGPSGLGKTTLLTALRDVLPLGTRQIYPRGCFETFAFLADQHVEPATSALLINEISPHLPVYLWGPAVARVLDTARLGFTLLATAHGESAIAFVASLTGSPLRIPAESVAAFRYVVLLEPSPHTTSGRQVSGVWQLRPVARGVDVSLIHSRTDSVFERGRNQEASGPTSPIAGPELQHRAGVLARLRDGLIPQLPPGTIHDLPSAVARKGVSADGLP